MIGSEVRGLTKVFLAIWALFFFYVCPLTNGNVLHRGIIYDATSLVARISVLASGDYSLFKDVWDGHAPFATSIYAFFKRSGCDIQGLILLDIFVGLLPLVFLYLWLASWRRNHLWLTGLLGGFYLRFYSSPAIFEYYFHLEIIGSSFLTFSLFIYAKGWYRQCFFRHLMLYGGLVAAMLCKEQFLFPSFGIALLAVKNFFEKRHVQWLAIEFGVTLLLLLYCRDYMMFWYEAYEHSMFSYVQEIHFSWASTFYKVSKVLYALHVFSFWKVLFVIDILMLGLFLKIFFYSKRKEELMDAVFLSSVSVMAFFLGSRYYGHYFLVCAVPIIYSMIVFLKDGLEESPIFTKCWGGVAVMAMMSFGFEMKEVSYGNMESVIDKDEREVAQKISELQGSRVSTLAYYHEFVHSKIGYHCYDENLKFGQYFADPRYGFHEKYEPWFYRYCSALENADFFVAAQGLSPHSATTQFIEKMVERRTLVLENEHYRLYHQSFKIGNK